jgi:chloramphenicol O-acetyltransferase
MSTKKANHIEKVINKYANLLGFQEGMIGYHHLVMMAYTIATNESRRIRNQIKDSI